MENNENMSFENEETVMNEAEVAVEEAVSEAADVKSINWKKEIMDWVWAIVIALVVSFVLKNYVLTLAKVQGESMEPTLYNSDRLYVNRLMYEPEKGDVVIFTPASDPKRPYIKRIIATEGDTVYIDFVTGDVYVNDEIIDEPYINETTRLSGAYMEYMRRNEGYSRENPIVVGEDKLFVMGDNRNHSKDSREIGQVPVDELIGHAVFRFWPIGNMGNVDYDYEAAEK